MRDRFGIRSRGPSEGIRSQLPAPLTFQPWYGHWMQPSTTLPSPSEPPRWAQVLWTQRARPSLSRQSTKSRPSILTFSGVSVRLADSSAGYQKLMNTANVLSGFPVPDLPGREAFLAEEMFGVDDPLRIEAHQLARGRLVERPADLE